MWRLPIIYFSPFPRCLFCLGEFFFIWRRKATIFCGQSADANKLNWRGEMTLVIDPWPTSQTSPLSSPCTFKSQKHFISIPSSFPNSIFKSKNSPCLGVHLAASLLFRKNRRAKFGFPPSPSRKEKIGIILRKSAVWSLLISQHFFLFDAGIRTCGFAGFSPFLYNGRLLSFFFPDFFSCAGLRVSIGHILFSFPPFLFP